MLTVKVDAQGRLDAPEALMMVRLEKVASLCACVWEGGEPAGMDMISRDLLVLQIPS